MKLHKQHTVVDDAWFCNLITVQGPGTSAEAVFPCYRWVQGAGELSLPEGTGEQAAIHLGQVGEHLRERRLGWGKEGEGGRRTSRKDGQALAGTVSFRDASEEMGRSYEFPKGLPE